MSLRFPASNLGSINQLMNPTNIILESSDYESKDLFLLHFRGLSSSWDEPGGRIVWHHTSFHARRQREWQELGILTP